MSDNVFGKKLPVYSLFSYSKDKAVLKGRDGSMENKKEFIAKMQERLEKVEGKLSEAQQDVDAVKARGMEPSAESVKRVEFLQGKVKDIRESIQRTQEYLAIQRS